MVFQDGKYFSYEKTVKKYKSNFWNEGESNISKSFSIGVTDSEH